VSTRVEVRRIRGRRLMDVLPELLSPFVRVRRMVLRVAKTGEVEVVDCEYEVEIAEGGGGAG
jgi:hypothetical protein